jgi:hypothetical protein
VTVIPIIRMDRVGRIAPHRPNPLLASHAALFLAVHAFNTDRLPGTASEDDVLQLRQQIGTILLCAADLAEKVANEVDASVAGSRLMPPAIGAILRDTIKDHVLDPLDATAELARVATLEAAE